ncbi:MAG: hypothetical protein ACREXG_12845 [Polaromonas sp.]
MNEFKHLRLNSSGPANNFTSAQRQAVSELKHFPARKRWLVPVLFTDLAASGKRSDLQGAAPGRSQ